MCNTRKRILGGIGIFFAILGIALLGVGYGSTQTKWDDENCCDGGTGRCESSLCNLACTFGSTTVFQKDACCYSIDASGPNGLIFLYGIGALGAVIVTVLTLELGDAICCECCQKFTAVVLAIINGVGMVFVIVLLVVLLDKTASDLEGCPDENVESLLGTTGITIAATLMLAAGVACSIVVTFIECCCDDSNKDQASVSA